MKKRTVWKTDYEKDFAKVFSRFASKYTSWTVWRDFVILFATAISNFLETDKNIFDDREQMYLNIVKKYSEEELDWFLELATITMQALRSKSHQDFLGELYMGLDFGSSWHGQFFTPWHIAHMMAKIVVEPSFKRIDEKGYIAVNDPTCGAGCLLIAAAAVYQENTGGKAFQDDMLFVGQDIDPVVALMCYIQLSILGCAGYVIIGDSLNNPVFGHELNPRIGEGSSIWYTPRWNSALWLHRRIENLFKEAIVHPQFEAGGHDEEVENNGRSQI